MKMSGRRDYDRYENDGGARRAGGKKSGGIGSFITTLLLIIAIGVFAFSAFRLYSYWKEYHKGESEYSDLNRQYVRIEPAQETGGGSGDGAESESQGAVLTSVTDLENETGLEKQIQSAKKEKVQENGTVKTLPELYNPIDFRELQAINPEVIGWIRVGGVGISYPVAQAEDNEFYLHRTFKKEAVFSGCIFENCDNSKYFTDQNTIIYGHNMKDGSMFASLIKFWEDEDAIGNPYFWIFTPDFIFQYRIFSCSVVSKMGDPYRTRFLTEDFQKFLDTMQNASEVDCGDVKLSTDDRIVTLSTCTGNDATRRIVQGRLQQAYVAKYRDS